MRIKINGRDLKFGDHVTFESSEYSDSMAYTVILAGAAAILWILKDWRWS